MVSLLDEALEAWLVRGGQAIKGTLHEHIASLERAGEITSAEAAELRQLKSVRNALAHEAQPKDIDWPDLDMAIDRIGAILERLGLVGPRPVYEVVAEQGKAENSTEPGVLLVQPFSVRIEEHGQPVRAFSWMKKVHRS